MTIELFRCHRLDASITKRTCEINKARKTDIYKGVYSVKACEGCTGLGDPININPEEVVAKKICSVDGCSSVIHARGMCWKHERSVLGVNPSTGKPVKPANKKTVTKAVKVNAKPVKLPVPSVVVPRGESILAPVISEFSASAQSSELNNVFEKKRLEFVEDLYGCTTERSRAEVFLSMLKSVEGMVY